MSDNIEEDRKKLFQNILIYSNISCPELENYYNKDLFDVDDHEDNQEENDDIIKRHLISYQERMATRNDIQLDFFQNCSMQDATRTFKNAAELFPNVSSLEIIFYYYNQGLSSEDYENIASFIQKLHTLKNLSFIITCCYIENFSYNIFDIFQFIKTTPSSLISLAIDLQQMSICMEDTLRIIKFIESITHLQKLELSIGRITGNSANIAHILGQSFKNLINLNDLSLNLTEKKYLTNKGLIDLIDGIKYLKNLRKLHLNIFNYEDLDKNVFDKMKECFQSLNLLASLEFILQCNNITNEGIIQFGNCFSHLSNLEELIVENMYKHIQNFNTQLALSNIFEGLPKISKLNFRIRTIQFSESINQIFDKIYKLKSLNKLSIEFFERPQYYDHQMLRDISFDSSLFSNLTNLSVRFPFYLNCESLIKLCNGLLQIKQITSLGLDFNTTQDAFIETMLVISIFQQLVNLKFLRFHTFIFFQQATVVNPFLEQVFNLTSQSIKSLENLNHLDYNINFKKIKQNNLIKRKLKRLILFKYL